MITLTESADTKVGTTGNDTFNGSEISVVVTGLTASLTALDNLDGGAGTDTLNVTATALALDTTGLGLTIKNIEIANFQATKALTVDSSAWTGFTNLNVTKSVADAVLTAANTTDINVAGAEAVVTTNGGKSITFAQKMDTTAENFFFKGGGAVTVTATDSISGALGIDIGNTTAVTGAVVVNSTGAKIVGGTTGTIALDTIAVNGGGTVSVTQAATADMGDVATKGAVTDSITQGAVTITGGNATTSVSVIQGDQVTAVAAKAAVAAVASTCVVTFGLMAAAGDSVTVNGLTFTSNKALTAVEVAAAFGSLTLADIQANGGVTANGTYTAASNTAAYTSGAAVGATVTYSSATTLTLATPTKTGTAVVPTATAPTAATAAVTAVTGVLGVANGAVVVNDNAVKSITTVVVDGYSAGAAIGNTTPGTTDLNALTTLTLANSGGGAATVRTSATTLALTVNDVNLGAGSTGVNTVTFDAGGATLKSLNVTTATKDSAIALTAAAVTDLTVAGTNALNLTGSTLSALEKVTVSGTAGLTVVGANV